MNEILPWQPGDVVLAADRRLFVRAPEGLSGGGRWPWREGAEYAPDAGHGPEGGTEDTYVARPVTLLIRDGRPFGGVVVDDRVIPGAVVRDELPAPHTETRPGD